MNEENNVQSKEQGRSFSIIFGIIIIIAVCVCLGGMISSCIQFSVTTKAFSDKLENGLLTISSRAAMSDQSNALPDGSPSDPSAGIASNKDDTIDSLITHMENMVAIQKSGMTNDVMSFIYGILSSVLVGLCATFVVKSQTNADNANKTADKARLQAEIAEEKAKETKEAIKQAKDAAEIAEEKAKETKEAIKQAKDATEMVKVLSYQIRLVIISSRIVSARAALAGLNNLHANKLISQIRDEVSSLFSDEVYRQIMKSEDFEDAEIGRVYDDLSVLQQDVKVFLKAYKETITNDESIQFKDKACKSIESAADNYQNWIKTALDCMNNAGSEMPNPAR